MWECDSEALLQAVPFLGCWECDSEALLQAVHVLRFGECDRCLGMLGVRSLFGDVWSAIAVWDVGMRSLLGCGGAIAFGYYKHLSQ